MFLGLTDRVLSRPKGALVAVLLLIAGLGAGMHRLYADTDVTNDLPQDLPAKLLYDRIEDLFPAKEIVFTAVEGDALFTVAGAAKLARLTARLEALEGVQSVMGPTNAKIIEGRAAAGGADGDGEMSVSEAADPLPTTPAEAAAWKARLLSMPMMVGALVSEDARAVAFVIFVKAGAREADVGQRVVELTEDPGANEGLTIHVGGRPAVMHWAKVIMARDMGMLSSIALLVVLLVLLLTFRSGRGVLLPMLVVIGGVVGTLGLSGWLGLPMTHSTEVMPILLIAIGVADGIHILKGYYARAREGGTPREVVRATMADLNRPVVLTSITTALGFMALNLSGIESIMRLGFLTAFGVMVAMVLSVVMIPASLALMKLPKASFAALEAGKRARFEGFEALADRYARALVRRRGPVLGALVALCGVAAWGGTRVVSEMSNLDNFRPDHPLHRASLSINEHFGGTTNLTIVVDGGRPGAMKQPAVLAKLDGLERFVAGLPHVGHVRSLTGFIKQMNKVVSGDAPDQYRLPREQERYVERWVEEVDGREVAREEAFTVPGATVVAQLLETYFVGGKPGDFATMVTYDFSTAKIDVFLDSDKASVLDEVATAVRGHIQAHFGELGAELTGMAELMRAVNEAVVSGQGWSILTSLLLVWLVTALLLRSMVLGLFATLPLFFSLFLNFGVMGFGAIPLNIMTMATSSVAVGVGIDYAIHFVHRVQQERLAGLDFDEAVPAAMRSSGVAIGLNALTVAAGFFALFFSAYRGVAHMGLLISLTMVSSAFAALTILPVVFVWLRPRAFTRHTPPQGASA